MGSGPTHGLPSTYVNYGCRCDVCRAANTKRGRRGRSQRAQYPPERIPHGVGGYLNYDCRCDICKAAGAVKNRIGRERRKARNAEAAS